DGQVDRAIGAVEAALGSLTGVDVLVLGLTYRHGVKELAYSRAIPLVEGLQARGARVLAYDPLLSGDDVARLGAEPWTWGSAAPGQEYDAEMAGPFYRERGLPRPDHELGVGGGTHAEQTGSMLAGLDALLTEHQPDAVLVYGDTNSTLAGALAGGKAAIPVA